MRICFNSSYKIEVQLNLQIHHFKHYRVWFDTNCAFCISTLMLKYDIE